MLFRSVRAGTAGQEAYLLLEFLDLGDSGDYAALGRMVAALHRAPADRFGWRRDNYIGSTPQANGWCDDWDEFWIERRLRPQLALARSKGFDLRFPAGDHFRGHKPKPSPLHGDLWSGNAGFTASGPVVFDPAVYCGDREADLAMTELFGDFRGRSIARTKKPFRCRRDTRSASPSTTSTTCSTTSTSSVEATSSRWNRRYAFCFSASSFCSSPDWYISRMMSEPPTNSPLT